MGKYKLMLVDDEPWALVGLQEIIDWEETGSRKSNVSSSAPILILSWQEKRSAWLPFTMF